MWCDYVRRISLLRRYGVGGIQTFRNLIFRKIAKSYVLDSNLYLYKFDFVTVVILYMYIDR